MRNSSGETNWWVVDPWVDFFPSPSRNDQETPADALCPELQKTKDPWSTDLKQELVSLRDGI